MLAQFLHIKKRYMHYLFFTSVLWRILETVKSGVIPILVKTLLIAKDKMQLKQKRNLGNRELECSYLREKWVQTSNDCRDFPSSHISASFLLIILLVYLFGFAGSSFLRGLFSTYSEWGLLSSFSVWASHCSSFSCCGSPALWHRLNSCATWA